MSTLPADVVMSRVHIERLSFAPEQPYSAIEAAIHLNRYLLVREICAGKRVLDAGCGEGYGSFLMAERWGAASVTALDISESAIDAARKRFPSGKIEYTLGECETLDIQFAERRFDVIVAFEAIEHVHDAAAFLRAAKRVLAPGGVIVITCPNDHWYYRDSRESNPFHVRKFRFDEFRTFTEEYLGKATGFMIGTPVGGYANIAASGETVVPESASMRLIVDAARDTRVVRLPADDATGPQTCAYFTGVWGPEGMPLPICATLFPVSLDNSGLAVRETQVENLQDEVRSLRQRVYDAEKALQRVQPAHETLVRETAKAERAAAMRFAAIKSEAEFVREELHRAHARTHDAERAAASLREQAATLESQRDGLARRIAELEALSRTALNERDTFERMLAERDAYIRETWLAKAKRFGGKVVRKLTGRTKGD